ncbi:MAG: Fe-S cluster assembly ATPase SufC [Thermoplasmata archaeon]
MISLKIEDIHAEIENKEILRGVNLEVRQGEIHALMGPNGSGKTTLAHIIFGDKRYKITKGRILIDDEDITNLPTEERAKKGLFLTFQAPISLPGVKLFTLIRSAYLAEHPTENINFKDFITKVQEKSKVLSLDPSFLGRNTNEGFSGGERKKSEILQMATLLPKIAVVDEIDSGLDVDALETVANSLNNIITGSGSMGALIITHYQRILKYLKPHYVHVLYNGKILKSGDYSLAMQIEEKGYDWIRNM